MRESSGWKGACGTWVTSDFPKPTTKMELVILHKGIFRSSSQTNMNAFPAVCVFGICLLDCLGVEQLSWLKCEARFAISIQSQIQVRMKPRGLGDLVQRRWFLHRLQDTRSIQGKRSRNMFLAWQIVQPSPENNMLMFWASSESFPHPKNISRGFKRPWRLVI